MLLDFGFDNREAFGERGLMELRELGVFGFVVEFDGIVVLFLVEVDGDFLYEFDMLAVVGEEGFGVGHGVEELLVFLNFLLIVLGEFLGFIDFFIKFFADGLEFFLM
jgi:hypothetical protein